MLLDELLLEGAFAVAFPKEPPLLFVELEPKEPPLLLDELEPKEPLFLLAEPKEPLFLLDEPEPKDVEPCEVEGLLLVDGFSVPE